ncbi:MAG: hypothetical protein QXX81_05150 [Zestosphaera sp.]
MPIMYRCSSCGETLFIFKSVGQDSFGVPTPDELFSKVGSRCPNCGKLLIKPTLNKVKVLGRA